MEAKFLDHQWKTIESLSNDDGDDNEYGKKNKKTIGLYKQNNYFALASRFFVHFLAVDARLRHETFSYTPAL